MSKRETIGKNILINLLDTQTNILNVQKNIKDYNTKKDRKIPIIFDDMIAAIKILRKLTEFVYDRTLSISIVFITQCYLISKRH